MRSSRQESGARPHSSGFTTIELLVALAIASVFAIMLAGFVFRTSELAERQQSRGDRRSSVRFALSLMSSELAETGGRLAPGSAFSITDTINGVEDSDIADLGTDTIGTLRSRTGGLSSVVTRTGTENGTMQLEFHVEDSDGEMPACPDEARCVESFEAEHGGNGDYLLVYNETQYWIVQLSADPTAEIGAGGTVNVSFEGIYDNTGGLDFAVGSIVTGIEVRTFRVKDETLEVKAGFYDPDDPDEGFGTLAPNIEDLQISYWLTDGTTVNDGLPADPVTVMATFITLVAVSPEDQTAVNPDFIRPEIEDHEAGDSPDRRRRSVARQIILARNLALPPA